MTKNLRPAGEQKATCDIRVHRGNRSGISHGCGGTTRWRNCAPAAWGIIFEGGSVIQWETESASAFDCSLVRRQSVPNIVPRFCTVLVFGCSATHTGGESTTSTAMGGTIATRLVGCRGLGDCYAAYSRPSYAPVSPRSSYSSGRNNWSYPGSAVTSAS